MTKKIPALILISFLTFDIATISFAGVANSKHDMFFMQKGTDLNVCSYCHIPHNAAGDKIWSSWANEAWLTSGPSTAIGNMCYTCHDGTVAPSGNLEGNPDPWLDGRTPFNASLQQHKISSGKDCDMCHTVHDNINGMFMAVPKTESAASRYSPTYCETCHGVAPYSGAEHLGDHLAGTEHRYSGIGGSCKACHKVHGAENDTATGLTNPILKWDNSNGNLCNVCHNALNYPGYSQEPGGIKHPASLSSPGAWGNVDCETCHDPHQPGATNHPFILTGINQDSGMCIDCHDGTKGPDIGQHTHPNQIAFGDIVPTDGSAATGTPPGNVVDDDGSGAPDYPLNSANVICETCHSVHRKADDPGTKLLRITNTGSVLCLNCHQDKE